MWLERVFSDKSVVDALESEAVGRGCRAQDLYGLWSFELVLLVVLARHARRWTRYGTHGLLAFFRLL